MTDHNTPPSSKPESWESQALVQILSNIQEDQKSERRWRNVFRGLRSFGIIGMLLMLAFATFNGADLLRKGPNKSEPHTAYINVLGEIAAGSLTDADHVIPAIQEVFDNPHAKALVLRINSPGGSPVQSGRIYDEIRAQQTLHPDKKVYAVIDDIGASGGYYIAAAADYIYADRASMVGSIGVISSGFGFTDLMTKLGIERRAITSGKNKALLDPFSPLTPEIESFWKEVLSQTHQQFIDRVKEGRGDRLSSEPEIFSGLMWNGEQAKTLGLIDGLGGMNDIARKEVGEAALVNYTPENDIFKQISTNTRSVSTLLSTLSPVRTY